MVTQALRTFAWPLVAGLLFVGGCDRPAEDGGVVAPVEIPPPGAPAEAPPASETPLVPPLPLQADPPEGDSTEIAISDTLWARMEHGRDLAFRAVGPEPFIPFALYDPDEGDEGEELRRYSGADIQIVLATARRDMARHARSSYVIAHHGFLTQDDTESSAVILEGCERITGECHRFAQRYRFRAGAAPELVGDLLYLGPCLSAFGVSTQPAGP